MRYLTILLLLFVGCGSPIIGLYDYLPKKERIEQHKSPHSVLRYYFTDNAYEVLKNIPVYNGPTIHGSYVGGANFWGSLASFVTFNGLRRNIIMSKKALRAWGVGALIHEYIHHLDDIGRDGGTSFIDTEEFLKEFHKLPGRYMLVPIVNERYIKMYPYIGDYQAICKLSDRWVTNVFGIGEHSELIAFAAQYFKKHNNWPRLYRRVFKRIFK